jgi:hypothetical protein
MVVLRRPMSRRQAANSKNTEPWTCPPGQIAADVEQRKPTLTSSPAKSMQNSLTGRQLYRFRPQLFMRSSSRESRILPASCNLMATQTGLRRWRDKSIFANSNWGRSYAHDDVQLPRAVARPHRELFMTKPVQASRRHHVANATTPTAGPASYGRFPSSTSSASGSRSASLRQARPPRCTPAPAPRSFDAAV